MSAHLAIGAVGVLAGLAALGRRGSAYTRRAQADDAQVRFTPSQNAPTARLRVDGRDVGHLQVTRIVDFDDEDNYVIEDCRYGLQDLEDDLDEDFGGSVVFVAWRSGLDEEQRGRGYGVMLYEAMLAYLHQREGQPVILIPEACMEGGNTSDEAMRVWESLGRRYLSAGDAVTSVSR